MDTPAAAPALGLAVGGPLVDLFGWRVVFLLQAGLSLVALVIAFAVLQETPRKRVRFDIAGSISLAIGIGGLMFALGSLRNASDGFPLIVASLAVGCLGMFLFVTIQRRIDHPLLPLEFFRARNFTATLLTNAFTSGGYMGAFVIAPLFLSEFGFTMTTIAFIILLRTATLAIASPFGGRLGEHMGERGASLFGCTLMTIGLAATVMATRWLESLLFGVSPTDGATLVVVSGVLLLVALAACHGPAHRATRVDPNRALAEECRMRGRVASRGGGARAGCEV